MVDQSDTLLKINYFFFFFVKIVLRPFLVFN